MKKVILVMLIAVVVASIFTTTAAFASQSSEIAQKIKKLEGVADAKVAIYQNVCFVAVKPSGIMQKTECLKLREQIIKTVTQDNENMQVAVSFSVKLFCQIEKIEKLPQEQQQKELNNLLDKLSKIPMPLKSN